jgi:transposase
VRTNHASIQTTHPPFVLVAIDIAKDSHEILIEAPGWKKRKCSALLNTATAFRWFADHLHSLHLPVRIAFEATENYHRALAFFLADKGFEL